MPPYKLSDADLDRAVELLVGQRRLIDVAADLGVRPGTLISALARRGLTAKELRRRGRAPDGGRRWRRYLSITLSEEEDRALRAYAAEHDVQVSLVVAAALRHAGITDPDRAEPADLGFRRGSNRYRLTVASRSDAGACWR